MQNSGKVHSSLLPEGNLQESMNRDRLIGEATGEDASGDRQAVSKASSNNDASRGNGGSLLDPHLSLLEYLENDCSGVAPPGFDRGATTSDSLQEMAILSGLKKDLYKNNYSNDISDSWQQVERINTPLSVSSSTSLKNVEYSGNANSNVGILSSSDTSEEDLQRDISSSNLIPNTLIQQPNKKNMVNNNNINTTSSNSNHDQARKILMASSVSPGKDKHTPTQKELEDDSVTITKSLTSSSTSFIMPKLSLKKTQVKPTFKILILGKSGLQFMKNIPGHYQYIFQLPTSHNPTDYNHYTGILLVIQDIRELISLLNRISNSCSNIPIIPVYERDQRIQVKNILKSFMRKNLITLLYQPVDISDEENIEKLFGHLNALAEEFNNSIANNNGNEFERNFSLLDEEYNVDNDEREQENGTENNRIKKRKMSQKNKLVNNRKDDKNKKHIHDNDNNKDGNKKISIIYNKWVIWGVSLTMGVGVGYCISYVHSTYGISITASYLVDLALTPMKKYLSKYVSFLGNDVKKIEMNGPTSDSIDSFTNSTDPNNENCSTSQYISYCLKFFKNSLKKINSYIKHAILKPISHRKACERISEWTVDDTNSLLALGYIIV